MKTTKSVIKNGIVTEILTINGFFYVRKRAGSKTLSMTKFNTLDLAARHFEFIRA